MLTTKQAAMLERAKALLDANPNDATATMELVRGLVGVIRDAKIVSQCGVCGAFIDWQHGALCPGCANILRAERMLNKYESKGAIST